MDKAMQINDSGTEAYTTRLLIGTASTGLVRMEWVMARFSQIIPINWSNVQMNENLPTYTPLRYQVADAQNLIVREAVAHDFEWLFLLESDNVLPDRAFILLDEYMRKRDVPIVSGLYYTREIPSEPLIFRGRGNGPYTDWKRGDLVWCDGVPTGALLIHGSILKAMWNESPEYVVDYGTRRELTRRVFDTPRMQWFDPEAKVQSTISGTSDLNWCTRIMKEGFLEKAGWKKYVKKEFPFLVDTRLFVGHIDPDGRIFPPGWRSSP